MIRSLVNVTPAEEIRQMEEMFDRLFGAPVRVNPSVGPLALDVMESNGNFILKAAVPGIPPEELEISIENRVLTIRGEHKQETPEEDVRLYRRELVYGSFARSIRLPQNLDLEKVDATFTHGVVTITIPKLEEVKPAALRVPVRMAEAGPTAIEANPTPEPAKP